MKINPQSLPELARHIAVKPPYVLLHSGNSQSSPSQNSYLAYNASRVIKGQEVEALRDAIGQDANDWWAGYFGYGLKNQLESLSEDIPSPIDLPDYWWICFETVLRINHATGELEAIKGELPQALNAEISIMAAENAALTTLSKTSEHTTLTHEEYVSTITQTIEAINAGAFYEANITQKYWGELEAPPACPLTLFECLINNANTPYSALMCLDADTHIYSASPECFLKANGNGSITSHPIKGSMKRSDNAEQDESLKSSLLSSEKNRAENLMIVDLIRNDLARVCEMGSINVDSLFEVKSYETIHHMVSQISGKLQQGRTTLDAVMASFPPGSMTGAPKIAAMEWCSKKEKLARGVYSGALGWIAGDGSADLSVVIRTLIIQHNRYEYQMGGAIVADSDPQEEWDEMRLKAKVIESLFSD